MARQVTKAGNNRYCQARLKAARWNEKLLTRSGAADVMGCVTEDSIKKYELGLTCPPNDVVALMAKAYNSPELILWHCAKECPLGKNCREVPEMPPERAFVRLSNVLDKLKATKLLEVAELMDNSANDKIERKTIQKLWDEFLEARRRIDEVLCALEKLRNKPE